MFITFCTVCDVWSQITVWKENPHYFSYNGKPLLLITSDHHYGAVIDMDFDFGEYLNYLGDNGMNLTRIYPGGMFEPPDKYQKGNPLGPLPGRQLLPWKRTTIAGASPLLAEAGKPSYKYDLDKWEPEYFKRLKAFVLLASKKNIIVEIAFFNGMYADCWPLNAMYHGNNTQNAGRYEMQDCGLFTTNDPRNQSVIKYQKQYIKKIVSELNSFDNIIFDICDEPSLQGLPDGNIIVHPDSLIIPWINIMKDAFTESEKSLPKKHLLGQTVQNLSPDLSGEKWCEWLPTEYVRPAEKALNLDYMRNKPIVDVETNYFGMSLTKNVYSADAVRMEGWWFILGGGAGLINLNGDFHRGNEEGGEISRTEIVPQKRILKSFMDSLDLAGLTRFFNFHISSSVTGISALSEPGKQYAIYLYHGSPDKEWGCSFIPEPSNYNDTLVINSVPAGKYRIEWIEPSSGIVKESRTIKWDGGNLRMTSPSYMLDMAMKMKLSD